jgi:exonuclease SbcC
MCYGEDVPPLDFEGMHVTCLSGNNGAGKSALLDALTWALWGKARAKSDDDLIMVGRDEMEVVLDFLLDGQLYRVIRRRKRQKRAGMTTLMLQAQEAMGGWRNLSGDTIAETQEAISRVLRIEYDTFVNSAFLMQGRADEFTGRKPAERKQVLADILGFGEYEELERRAKDEMNRLGKELDELRHFLEHLQQQAAQQPLLEQLLAEARERVVVAEDELRDHEERTEDIRAQATQLEVLHRERVGLAQSIMQIEQAQSDIDDLLVALRANVQQFEQTIGRRQEIEAGAEQLIAADLALHEMEARREQYDELGTKYREWDGKLKEIRHTLEIEQRSASEHLVQLDQQIARRATVQLEQTELDQQRQQMLELEVQLHRLRADEKSLIEQQTLLLELQVQATKLQGRIDVQRDSLLAAQHAEQQRIIELQTTASLMSQAEQQLRDVRGELLRFRASDDELATRRDELAQLTERQGALQAEYQAVEAEGKEIANKLQLVEQGDATCPVCDSALGADGLARLLAQYEEERTTLRSRIKQLRREGQNAKLEAETQRSAIEQLERRLLQRADVDAQRVTLEIQIDQARDAQVKIDDLSRTLAVITEQLTQHDFAHEERRQLNDINVQLSAIGDIAHIKQALGAVRAEILTIEGQVKRAERSQQRAALVADELAKIGDAEVRRPLIAERYEQLSNQLRDETYGIVERQERDRVQAAGVALGYRKEEHVALREHIAGLRHWERELIELERALKSVETERAHLGRNEKQRTRYDTELAQKRQQLAQLDVQLRDKPLIDQALREAEQRTRTLRQRLDSVQSERVVAQERLETCEKNIRLLADQLQRVSQLSDERAVYEELTQAFGKKGIQAMLIETAIPELEHEANELLSRMTENQFHLAFETQRDTKKGDSTIETLDIRIADSLGTRDYHMYSGGEAFRINFAVRIALSKLLARRAGASLKTLIIDEGFGSQDGTGRDRLVEAINSIGPEFERILVITHIQELKELFPTQIEIKKTPDGSTWSVM